MKNLLRLSILILALTSWGCKKEHLPEESQGDREVQREKLITTCDYSQVESSLRFPKTINESVDLINALPKPLSLACFIESLSRPLKVNLTLSKLSAQPAVGDKSPRIFLFLDSLILSIAPEGKGAPFLELSQMYSDSYSLKAELQFPVLENITYQTGYDRIVQGEMTTCGTCHNNEALDTTVSESNAYVSVAIKPDTNLALDTFSNENYLCQTASVLTYRCQMILALFKHDNLLEESFPAGTPKMIETVDF